MNHSTVGSQCSIRTGDDLLVSVEGEEPLLLQIVESDEEQCSSTPSAIAQVVVEEEVETKNLLVEGTSGESMPIIKGQVPEEYQEMGSVETTPFLGEELIDKEAESNITDDVHTIQGVDSGVVETVPETDVLSETEVEASKKQVSQIIRY